MGRFRSCCWELYGNSEGEWKGLNSADDNIISILGSISSMRLFNSRCLFPGLLVASMQVLPDFWHLRHGLPGFGWSHLT